jgi:mono/diheme cytochrome c family protein
MRGCAALELWVVATICLVLGACAPRDQSPVGRGGRVFQRTCSGCHGADGRGVMRLGLSKPPRDLTNAEFHAQVTDEQLRSVIRTGKGQMPAFGGLMGEDDLNDVIAFIRTLPPGGRRAAPAGGALPSAPATQPPGASSLEPSTAPSALVTPAPPGNTGALP